MTNLEYKNLKSGDKVLYKGNIERVTCICHDDRDKLSTNTATCLDKNNFQVMFHTFIEEDDNA